MADPPRPLWYPSGEGRWSWRRIRFQNPKNARPEDQINAAGVTILNVNLEGYDVPQDLIDTYLQIFDDNLVYAQAEFSILRGAFDISRSIARRRPDYISGERQIAAANEVIDEFASFNRANFVESDSDSEDDFVAAQQGPRRDQGLFPLEVRFVHCLRRFHPLDESMHHLPFRMN